jgi:hypothetical protein
VENIPFIFISLYALGALISLGIITWLIVKRIKAKKEEKFEERSN